MTVNPEPVLCECAHDPDKHVDETGRCLAPDSYGVCCTCPSYVEMNDDDPDGLVELEQACARRPGQPYVTVILPGEA